MPRGTSLIPAPLTRRRSKSSTLFASNAEHTRIRRIAEGSLRDYAAEYKEATAEARAAQRAFIAAYLKRHGNTAAAHDDDGDDDAVDNQSCEDKTEEVEDSSDTAEEAEADVPIINFFRLDGSSETKLTDVRRPRDHSSPYRLVTLIVTFVVRVSFCSRTRSIGSGFTVFVFSQSYIQPHLDSNAIISVICFWWSKGISLVGEALNDDSKEALPPPPTLPRPLLKDRLYVGNLHPTVDEFTLVQIFSKYGNITKLDFLFHKSGPMKGKPRGYAFVEYGNQDDAAKALALANEKLLRGRKLVVTYAHQAPLDQASITTGRHRRAISEIGKPTTLSLLKSAAAGRSDGTDDKIAKMEAKLRQLEGSSSMVGHPSLPPKPVTFGFNGPPDSGGLSGTRNRHSQGRNSIPLPSLPLPAPQHPLPERPTQAQAASPLPHHPPPPVPRKGTPSLLGVKIKKHKET
ncbi:hypothetical protein NM688_g7075 [Phlebia brevispora]|uniref:Uncharacterized protein n=1 Tax=Phlebia brevispora TaxID=194682 RepID=A0ACC1S9F5_9APHY|nr:hypothetical protein NM688_g7075 [Phlebia brevispora]